MLNYLLLAAEVADLSADRYRKAFVGAVAIRCDGVIVSSRNGGVSDPRGRCPSIHSEVRVCRKAGFGATIYISRVKRDGSLALAKPCITCMQALKNHRVEAVYYTVSNDQWEGFRL